MKIPAAAALVAAALAASVPAQNARNRTQTAKPPKAAKAATADALLRRMTLREKIGQLIVLPLGAEFANVESAAFREMRRRIEKLGVGGFTLFRGEAASVAALTNEAQKLSKLPLFFAADYERGLRMQLRNGTPFTTNMGVAAAGDPRAAFEQGRIICEEMRAVGVNWLFAPVADVNNDPANPVINIRSFGADPQTVGRFVEQAVRGIRAANCLSTLKHFPGHGNTATDSHLGLSVIGANRAQLDAVELVPFRRGIAAGTDAVMTAHLALPNVTGDELPATLNPKIIDGLLRGELRFDGIVTTDSMEMGAITKSFPNGESAVMALKAGVDVVLFPPDPDAAVAAIEAAVARGDLSESRIDRSVRRLLAAKIRLGLFENRYNDPSAAARAVEKPSNVAAAASVAERSITLLRDADGLFPFRTAAERLYVVVAADDDPVEGATLVPEILKRRPNARIVRLDPRSAPADYESALAAADGFEEIFVAVFVKRAAAKGTVALPERPAAFIRRLSALPGKKTGVAAFGSPYLIGQFPDVRAYLAAYAIEDIAQTAAVRAVFGETAFRGRLPVAIPGLFETGAGILR